HVALNQRLKDFPSGSSIRSFLERDAVAVGHRFAWLKSHEYVEDDLSMLFWTIASVYGSRLPTQADLDHLQDVLSSVLGVDARPSLGELSTFDQPETRLSQSLARVGPWTLARDSEGAHRPGVPDRSATLPNLATFESVLEQVVAALQYDEVICLSGDAFV